MKSFNEFVCEATSKQTVVFTFGRMNPPTKGHEALMDFCAKQARQHNAELRIYLSHTQDRKKNPLSYTEKLDAVRKGMPRYDWAIYNSNYKNPFEIIEKDLTEYKNIIFCVGEDRAAEFGNGMKRYPNVKVVFIPRPPGAVSATLVRKAAQDNKFEEFKSYLPSGFKNDKVAAMNLMFKIQNALK